MQNGTRLTSHLNERTNTIKIADLLELNPNSKTGLTWKISISNRLQGSEAGRLWIHPKKPENRYYIVGIGGKQYKVHRIIWELKFGEIPEGKIIDHINGDSLDNRIENLRIATYIHNNSNKKKASNNTLGFSGVSWTVTNEGNLYFCAAVRYANKQHRKNFSVEKLGLLVAHYNACQWVVNKRKQLNLENGNIISDRHGQ